MSYFRLFPVIDSYSIQGKSLIGIDATIRNKVAIESFNNPSNYIEYEVRDGETPIILSDRLYDNVNWYWVIMLFNEIHDINSDWPLSNAELAIYVNRKYDDPQAIHHYESFYNGLVVDEDHIPTDRLSVTNFEYEYRLNEKKRTIRVPTPEAAAAIVAEHHRMIQL